jgi:hypothetical protein
MKNASKKLSNKLVSDDLGQKFMKIEEIDSEQNTVILESCIFQKKWKFFNFRLKL